MIGDESRLSADEKIIMTRLRAQRDELLASIPPAEAELRLSDFEDPEETRRVLAHCSAHNKLAVHNDAFIPGKGLPSAVSELVRRGALVYLHNSTLPFVALDKQGARVTVGVNADVYLLTPTGVRLCDAEHIPRR